MFNDHNSQWLNKKVLVRFRHRKSVGIVSYIDLHQGVAWVTVGEKDYAIPLNLLQPARLSDRLVVLWQRLWRRLKNQTP